MADYRTNADLIAEILHGAGVRYAAGIPSGQILALIDAMRQVGIDFVLTSHEGAAGLSGEPPAAGARDAVLDVVRRTLA